SSTPLQGAGSVFVRYSRGTQKTRTLANFLAPLRGDSFSVGGGNLFLILVVILIFLLNGEPAGDTAQLISRCEPPDLHDLCRRRSFGIDVGDGTGESSQSAFRSGVFDSLFLHQPEHQF